MADTNKKAKLTPTQQRFISYIYTLILLPFAFLIFQPTIIELLAASIAGLFTSVYDWGIEAYAYKKELWFCYGGIQKIKIRNRIIDFKHVPIDMIINFWFYGFMLSLLSTFTYKNRTTYHIITNPTLTNSILDPVWIGILCVIMATLGAIGDFLYKGVGVWKNGKNWTFAKCAYIAWLSLIGFTITVFYLVIAIFML